MNIIFTERFDKHFNKLPQKIQNKFEDRLEIFIKDPFHPILKVHPLKGYMTGLRAFSIAGEYRVIYKILNQDTMKMIDIGTHSQIYN